MIEGLKARPFGSVASSGSRANGQPVGPWTASGLGTRAFSPGLRNDRPFGPEEAKVSGLSLGFAPRKPCPIGVDGSRSHHARSHWRDALCAFSDLEYVGWCGDAHRTRWGGRPSLGHGGLRNRKTIRVVFRSAEERPFAERKATLPAGYCLTTPHVRPLAAFWPAPLSPESGVGGEGRVPVRSRPDNTQRAEDVSPPCQGDVVLPIRRNSAPGGGVAQTLL